MASNKTVPGARLDLAEPRATRHHHPRISEQRHRVDSPIMPHATGVHTMNCEYRVRLVKRDGDKTKPVNVHLDEDMKARELRQHLVGMVREQRLEWFNDPDRWIEHYALEVLKKRTDDVVHVYRGKE